MNDQLVSARSRAWKKASQALRQYPAVRRPDPARTVLRPFIPADNPLAVPAKASRIAQVIARITALSQAEAQREIATILHSLSRRHRDPAAYLERRFREAMPPATRGFSPCQRQLVGAYLSEEYAFEASAIFNPSIVRHPDQSRLEPGELRFLMSMRAVGEGHVSSIVFASGRITASGEPILDRHNGAARSPRIEFLPGRSDSDPDLRLSFGSDVHISEAVISPLTLPRRHGLEDLRLTPFLEDNGSCVHYGTYTAVGGGSIRQELLRTTDFRSFELRALTGRFAATKGMALFPRRLGGYFAMLGRQDHENIWLLRSGDISSWTTGAAIIQPRYPWEMVQIGNCGAPLEIEEGWLLLTHGVGAVRNYSIGACLLDKNDPSRLLARTPQPLLSPRSCRRAGNVPNVVYSCGGLVHQRRLLLPHGVSDTFTAFAGIEIDALLKTME